jgi:hypothetical protein
VDFLDHIEQGPNVFRQQTTQPWRIRGANSNRAAGFDCDSVQSEQCVDIGNRIGDRYDMRATRHCFLGEARVSTAGQTQDRHVDKRHGAWLDDLDIEVELLDNTLESCRTSTTNHQPVSDPGPSKMTGNSQSNRARTKDTNRGHSSLIEDRAR